jgi:hypothetical protein
MNRLNSNLGDDLELTVFTLEQWSGAATADNLTHDFLSITMAVLIPFVAAVPDAVADRHTCVITLRVRHVMGLQVAGSVRKLTAPDDDCRTQDRGVIVAIVSPNGLLCSKQDCRQEQNCRDVSRKT